MIPKLKILIDGEKSVKGGKGIKIYTLKKLSKPVLTINAFILL